MNANAALVHIPNATLRVPAAFVDRTVMLTGFVELAACRRFDLEPRASRCAELDYALGYVVRMKVDDGFGRSQLPVSLSGGLRSAALQCCQHTVGRKWHRPNPNAGRVINRVR